MTRNDLLKSYLQELYPAEVRSKSRRERFRRFFSHGLAGFFMANMALSISLRKKFVELNKEILGVPASVSKAKHTFNLATAKEDLQNWKDKQSI